MVATGMGHGTKGPVDGRIGGRSYGRALIDTCLGAAWSTVPINPVANCNAGYMRQGTNRTGAKCARVGWAEMRGSQSEVTRGFDRKRGKLIVVNLPWVAVVGEAISAGGDVLLMGLADAGSQMSLRWPVPIIILPIFASLASKMATTS